MATQDWVVGEKHGEFTLVEMTAKEATFEDAKGNRKTYPNIFQKKEARPIEKKVRQPKKKDSVKMLDDTIAAAKAKLAALKKLKA